MAITTADPVNRPPSVRQSVVAALLMVTAGACGPFCGNGKLNLSTAQINPTSYTCAAGANNFSYPITGTLVADNQSSKKISIKSMSDQAEVTKLSGGKWSISVGDKSGTDSIEFSPTSVNANTKTTVKFTLPWECTNPGGDTPNTYADFKIVLTLKTDSGNYSINLPNHRMNMAA